VITADHLWLLVLALVIDAIVGDPDAIWRRIPHPVVVIGGLVGWLDRRFNRDDFTPRRRRALGAGVLAAIVVAAWFTGYGIERLLSTVPAGWVGTAILAAILLAGRSLHDHVAAVANAFSDSIAAARRAVSRIVGRDAADLDEAGICRAAIESAAENFSDGVVAPALWFALLGLPGLFAYKAVNTADSMIGHRTPPHRDFGWAAARFDDFANFPASRLAGLLIALAAPLAGGSPVVASRVMIADAAKHASPNAGWPEAAMAGAMGLALAGPRRYVGVTVDDPFLNAAGRRAAAPADIRRALAVCRGAWAALLVAALALATA